MIKAAGLALLLGTACAAMPRKPRVDRSMETEGSYCKVTVPGHRVVTTAQQWQALWRDIGKKAPTADLAKNYAVAAFAGTRNSGGYAIAFDPPATEKGVVVIRYVLLRPRGMAIMALTQPYAVKLFPRIGDAPVRVEGREE